METYVRGLSDKSWSKHLCTSTEIGFPAAPKALPPTLVFHVACVSNTSSTGVLQCYLVESGAAATAIGLL